MVDAVLGENFIGEDDSMRSGIILIDHSSNVFPNFDAIDEHFLKNTS